MKRIGLIGLGRMGYNLALNMLDHEVAVYAYDKVINDEVKKNKQIKLLSSLKKLVDELPKPRIIWLMVPAGEITDNVINELAQYLDKEDILIDGGNSNYNDTLRRYHDLKNKNINLIDCGTSGGTEGARHGASLMVGGEEKIVKSIEWLFKDLATKDGYAYMGKPGSGHFVKMVHNGIEYGMMQAIGEGFELLEKSDFELDYQEVSKVWAHGSIIQGLLMDTAYSAFKKDETLKNIIGRVDDSGEGQWMVEAALKYKAAIPVISNSLFARYKSRDEERFSEKIVAAMRFEFGQHKVYKR
ncbi:MAG: decarboxylating 6-phosphogluconate dehydrogenase [Candidatus Izemoplasmatales bacterium]|jgi:6-phosphogluconate dehydrogenase|nr:decarboxylating 6-phosphogluconate dehydrogenase [Candidatus Izemoplasmatales bacterium]